MIFLVPEGYALRDRMNSERIHLGIQCSGLLSLYCEYRELYYYNIVYLKVLKYHGGVILQYKYKISSK